MRVKYRRHGILVSVEDTLEGRHREFCLCHKCKYFTPENREINCLIANALFENCVKYGVTTPVWECPDFIEK